MLLHMLDLYFTEEITAENMEKLAEQGIGSVWCEERTICSNLSDIEISLVDSGVNTGYQLKSVK